MAMGAAEIRVVQSRPYVGHFRVSPTEGVVGRTLFELSCTRWIADPDALPLLYTFGYSPDFDGWNPVEVYLASPMPGAVLWTRDIQPNGTSRRVQLFVDVRTALGSSERATAYVDVDADKECIYIYIYIYIHE